MSDKNYKEEIKQLKYKLEHSIAKEKVSSSSSDDDKKDKIKDLKKAVKDLED